MDTIGVDVLSALTGLPSVNGAGAATLAVAETADVITHSHPIQAVSNLVLMYKATVTTGTPDVDLYLQQGPGRPTTEGAAGDATDGWIQVGNKIADITDELWHSVTLSPIVLPFIRILCDGQGANPATCKLALKLGKQEALGV